MGASISLVSSLIFMPVHLRWCMLLGDESNFLKRRFRNSLTPKGPQALPCPAKSLPKWHEMMLKVSQMFESRLLGFKFAQIYSWLFKSIETCSKMFKDLQRRSEISKGYQTYSMMVEELQFFQHFLRVGHISHGFQRPSTIFKELQIFLKIRTCFRMILGTFKDFQRCSNKFI